VSEQADSLAMIDLDHVLWIEYGDADKEPLVLIEEAEDIGQSGKAATVTRNLARRAGLPAIVVLWRPSEQPNPAALEWPDIEMFRVKRAWPMPESEWRRMTPLEYAQLLLRVREWPGGALDEWLFRSECAVTSGRRRRRR